MTDPRPALAAALAELERIPHALTVAHDWAHSPLSSTEHADRVSGSHGTPTPQIADAWLLDRYSAGLRLLDAAQDTAHRLGWPTRSTIPDGAPHPRHASHACSILRSAVKWLHGRDHEQPGLVLKLCDQIHAAYVAVPKQVHIQPTPTPAKPKAKRCATPDCAKPTTQGSRFCSACRRHRTRHGIDRKPDRRWGRCVCPVHRPRAA